MPDSPIVAVALEREAAARRAFDALPEDHPDHAVARRAWLEASDAVRVLRLDEATQAEQRERGL